MNRRLHHLVPGRPGTPEARVSINTETLFPDFKSGADLRVDSLGSLNIQVAWRLRRDTDSARCVVCTVGDRVELHITMTQDVVMSQQCTGPAHASAIAYAWWSALIDRGWVEGESNPTLRAKADRRCT